MTLDKLKTDVGKAKAFLEKLLPYVPQEWKDEAATHVDSLGTAAGAKVEDIADAEIDKVAGPVFGPKIIAILNPMLDAAIAKVKADAEAEVDDLLGVKTALAPAVQS